MSDDALRLATELAKYGGDKGELIRQCVTIGPDAVPALLQVLEESEGGDVCRTLGMIGDKRAVQPLLKVFHRDIAGNAGWFVADDAAEALGKIGDPVSIEPLLRALGSQECGVKVSVAYALGMLGVAEVE